LGGERAVATWLVGGGGSKGVSTAGRTVKKLDVAPKILLKINLYLSIS
jgi:hypothetical protein